MGYPFLVFDPSLPHIRQCGLMSLSHSPPFLPHSNIVVEWTMIYWQKTLCPHTLPHCPSWLKQTSKKGGSGAWHGLLWVELICPQSSDEWQVMWHQSPIDICSICQSLLHQSIISHNSITADLMTDKGRVLLPVRQSELVMGGRPTIHCQVSPFTTPASSCQYLPRIKVS